jgi:hypothetical protein
VAWFAKATWHISGFLWLRSRGLQQVWPQPTPKAPRWKQCIYIGPYTPKVLVRLYVWGAHTGVRCWAQNRIGLWLVLMGYEQALAPHNRGHHSGRHAGTTPHSVDALSLTKFACADCPHMRGIRRSRIEDRSTGLRARCMKVASLSSSAASSPGALACL